jgi:tripartite-type tricarboxylate transporter receptor subunit TctC
MRDIVPEKRQDVVLVKNYQKEKIMKKAFAVFLLACVMVSGILFAGAGSDKAGEKFPSQPIKLIVPWTAGGATDAIARALAQTGQKHLGVPVVVENKPGGTGAVGLGETATAKADGYTLAILPVELGFLKDQGIYPFDFSNFTRSMNLNTDPAALTVKADAPWNNLGEFLDYARANPGMINIGHSGTGMIWHLCAAALASNTNTTYTYVPFDGAADAIASVLGNNIQAVTVSGAEVSAQVRAGTMKVLAVFDEKRLDFFPDVPTAREQGVDVVISTFRGLGGPAGIPDERVKILHDGFKAMMDEPGFSNLLGNLGVGIDYRNPQDYFKQTEDAVKTLAPLIKIAL